MRLDNDVCFCKNRLLSSAEVSPEGNESPLFVDGSSCVAGVAHRNFYSEDEHYDVCQTAFVLIDIAIVLISMAI